MAVNFQIDKVPEAIREETKLCGKEVRPGIWRVEKDSECYKAVEAKWIASLPRPTPKLPSIESAPLIAHGPGTYLWNSLKLLKLVFRKPCNCRNRATEMNERGWRWCEENQGIILGWLRHEAEEQGILFLEEVAKRLIQRSIRKAKQHDV